jgi:hypothetical protein
VAWRISGTACSDRLPEDGRLLEDTFDQPFHGQRGAFDLELFFVLDALAQHLLNGSFGKKQHGKASTCLDFSNLRDDLETGALGQDGVDQSEVGAMTAKQRERLTAIGRAEHVEPLGTEGFGMDANEVGARVDTEDGGGHGGLPPVPIGDFSDELSLDKPGIDLLVPR